MSRTCSRRQEPVPERVWLTGACALSLPSTGRRLSTPSRQALGPAAAAPGREWPAESLRKRRERRCTENLGVEGQRQIVFDLGVEAADLLGLIVAVDYGVRDERVKLRLAQAAHAGRILAVPGDRKVQRRPLLPAQRTPE